ncbi:uncharacterized protein LOC120496248 [Passer montanus]|uniref:uncharacterized protein LOC120496248 n=1 Tax=Passer montanus TaxID=9160 RepID=UPI00195F7504|nr:uncharacterized protein LOC120496248 [Passer montanus]
MMLLYSTSLSVSPGVLRPQLTHTLLSLSIFPWSRANPLPSANVVHHSHPWLCAPAPRGVARLGCCHCCHTSVPVRPQPLPGDSAGGSVTPGRAQATLGTLGGALEQAGTISMGFVIPVLSTGCCYGPGAPALHRPHPGRHTLTQDRRRPRTHGDPGHTGSQDIHRGTQDTHRGSQDTGEPGHRHASQLLCRLLHTKPRGQAGPCGSRRFPARSRCRSRLHRPQTHGHRHAGSVARTHGRDRSDSQVLLPSSLQREHRSVGRTQDLSEGRAPGAAVEHQLQAETTSCKYNCPGPWAAHRDSQGHAQPGSGSSGCRSGLGRAVLVLRWCPRAPQKHRRGDPCHCC